MIVWIDEYIYFVEDEGGENIAPGDLYVAKRNLDWEALICERNDPEHGWVVPDCSDGAHYYYDTHECHRVRCFWKSVLRMRG